MVRQRLEVSCGLDRLKPRLAATYHGYIDGKIDAQFGLIRRYAAENSDMIGAIEKEFPPAAVPVAISRKIRSLSARKAAFTYCFAPYLDTAGIVSAKRVLEAGDRFDVFSNNMSNVRKKDPELFRIAENLIGEFVETQVPAVFASWEGMRPYLEESVAAAARLSYAKGPYDEICSRALWPASHFAAALFKSRNPGTRWIAEYSDPIILDIESRERVADMDASWIQKNFPGIFNRDLCISTQIEWWTGLGLVSD